jgi:hypothetical protein
MPIQWQGCYGGFDRDYATDMVETDNGYMIIGTIYSDDGSDDGDIQSVNHGSFDTWIVKIDSSGEIIWEKCYGGSGPEEYPNIKLLNNGNLIVSTTTASNDGDLPAHYGAYDAWLFIISPEGEILKNAVFGNDLHNSIYDVIETQDGGCFFTCEASSTNGMVEGIYHGGMLDVWVVKLDNNMDIEWQMLYGGSDWDYGGYGIIELLDGYIFTVYTDSNDGDVSGFHGGFNDIWAVRIDFQGNIIWQRCLGGSDYESAGDLFQTEDEGFVIFGETKSNNGDVSGNHSYPNWGWSDIWMVKLSSEGVLEWQQCYGSYGDDKVYGGVIQKSDYNWVIAGSADYNSDDVNCNLHGEYVEDYWVFEIKDTSVNTINDNFDVFGIEMYPNPADTWVIFEYNLPALENEWEIIISDITGKPLERIKIFGSKSKKALDIHKYPAGVYFYTLSSGSIPHNTGKLIVK